MVSDQFPIIDQLQGAADDRVRADLLLRCADAVILVHETAFRHTCRHFPAGEMFVQLRVAAMCAVRSSVGGLPGKLALELELLRAELAAFAAGAPVVSGQAQGPPSVDI